MRCPCAVLIGCWPRGARGDQRRRRAGWRGAGLRPRARPGPPCFRIVDVRLPGKGNPNSHGARPVHLSITMIKWVRTSRLSIKNSLSRPRARPAPPCFRVYVRTGSWTGPPRGKRASRVGISSTVFGVRGVSSGRNPVSKASQIGTWVARCRSSSESTPSPPLL